MLGSYENTFCALLYSTLLLFRVSLRRTFMRIPWHMRCGLFAAVVNAHRSLKQKRRNCWIKLFLFSLRTKRILDVTWTILTMSLLPFWALNVVVVLLSMEGQKALGVHQKHLNLCSEEKLRSNTFRKTWGWVINDRIFIFGWTILLMSYEAFLCTKYCITVKNTYKTEWIKCFTFSKKKN